MHYYLKLFVPRALFAILLLSAAMPLWAQPMSNTTSLYKTYLCTEVIFIGDRLKGDSLDDLAPNENGDTSDDFSPFAPPSPLKKQVAQHVLKFCRDPFTYQDRPPSPEDLQLVHEAFRAVAVQADDDSILGRTGLYKGGSNFSSNFGNIVRAAPSVLPSTRGFSIEQALIASISSIVLEGAKKQITGQAVQALQTYFKQEAPQLLQLFPQAYTIIDNLNTVSFEALLPTLRNAFHQDLQALPLNVTTTLLGTEQNEQVLFLTLIMDSIVELRNGNDPLLCFSNLEQLAQKIEIKMKDGSQVLTYNGTTFKVVRDARAATFKQLQAGMRLIGRLAQEVYYSQAVLGSTPLSTFTENPNNLNLFLTFLFEDLKEEIPASWAPDRKASTFAEGKYYEIISILNQLQQLRSNIVQITDTVQSEAMNTAGSADKIASFGDYLQRFAETIKLVKRLIPDKENTNLDRYLIIVQDAVDVHKALIQKNYSQAALLSIQMLSRYEIENGGTHQLTKNVVNKLKENSNLNIDKETLKKLEHLAKEHSPLPVASFQKQLDEVLEDHTKLAAIKRFILQESKILRINVETLKQDLLAGRLEPILYKKVFELAREALPEDDFKAKVNTIVDTAQEIEGDKNTLKTLIAQQAEYVIATPQEYKLLSFAATLVTAESPEDVQNALAAFVNPPGIFEAKRQGGRRFQLMVNAYLGGAYGKEKLLSNEVDRLTGKSLGLMAPVGLELRLRTDFRVIPTISFLGTLLDVGNFASLRIDEESPDQMTVPPDTSPQNTMPTQTTESLPEIGFDQVFSPGLFIVLGISKSLPISLGVGLHQIPKLRNVQVNPTNTQESGVSRFSVFFGVDVPLYRFF